MDDFFADSLWELLAHSLLFWPGLRFLRLFGHAREAQGVLDSVLCIFVSTALWAVLLAGLYGLLLLF